jgi:hypothetical protein
LERISREDKMKVKLFSKKNPLGNKGGNQLDLENEINSWLEKNLSIRLISIEQSAHWGSFDNSILFISVCYEESS